MSLKKLISMLVAIIPFTCAVAAQNQPQKVVKHVPITQTSAASGQEMYKNYCAVCHGVEGRGDGPAASALKVAPTDLTTLNKNNGGKFPALKVSSTIRGESGLPAHGSKEMPVWGSLFRKVSGGRESEVQQRVTNLTQYVESLQAK